MNFKPVTPFVQKEFSKYESLRSIYMSEGHFLNQFLWENYSTVSLCKKGFSPGIFCPVVP